MSNMRKKTVFFYIFLTLVIAAVIIITISTYSLPKNLQTSAQALISAPVVLDAGHGGQDGGATLSNGITEAPITLEITERISLLMSFLGIDNVLTRTEDISLSYNPELSIRDNKNADLKARLDISNDLPDSPFLSVHLNMFSEPEYSGAQVFYSKNNVLSQTLAQNLQQSLRDVLDPTNDRVYKRAGDGVYLMEQVNAPAVTIECGFLSNVSERELLVTQVYQTKIAVAVTAGFINYLEGK